MSRGLLHAELFFKNFPDMSFEQMQEGIAGWTHQENCDNLLLSSVKRPQQVAGF